MTHDDLRMKAISILRRSNAVARKGGWKHQLGFSCGVILSEISSAANDNPDAIGWSYGRSVMIECKMSRADFFADSKKPQRLTGTGAGERRYFMTPKGLLKPAELPENWGLIEWDGNETIEAVGAPKRQLDLLGHVAEKKMLLSTVRRIRMREFLIIQDECVPAH
jgi:hypothetical protein